MNHSLTIVCVAITILAIISGCKKEADNHVPNDCGGDLTAAPIFTDAPVQYKIDSGEVIRCTFPHPDSSAAASLTGHAVTAVTFSNCDAGTFRISVLNSSNPPAFYESLRPGNVPYVRNAQGAPARSIILSMGYDNSSYTTIGADNTGGTFEILSRSERFTKGGKTVATVQGIFCCYMYDMFSSGPLEFIPVSGNFSTEFEVE